MRINTYKTILNEDRIPTLVKESSCNYSENTIKGPRDIAEMLHTVFDHGNRTEEHVYEICLNSANRVIGVFEVSHGGLASAPIHPREVYQKAMLCGAAGILLAHNHPSGELSPSKQDIEETKRIAAAGELVGISLLDHLIIGEQGRYYSLLESGKMPGGLFSAES